MFMVGPVSGASLISHIVFHHHNKWIGSRADYYFCRVHVRLHKLTWFACLAECMQHSLIYLDVSFDDFGFEFELRHL